MASEAGRLIYSWNSSKWELLAALPQSPDWYPHHQEVPLKTLLMRFLHLSFPALEVGSSPWAQQALNLLCWPCVQGHYVDTSPCFKFGLKQGCKITRSGGWSKKTYKRVEHVSLHFMRPATLILASEQGRDGVHLLNKVLQLSLVATPCLLPHTSTVTSSPKYTFSLIKSRQKCPNI